MPFAILCDRENEYTDDFDYVITSNKISSTYMDKLLLHEASPFFETVFLDADCLAYSDLNEVFSIFEQADDFSCLGNTMPLDEFSSGWFSINTFPEKSTNDGIIDKQNACSIPYSVGLHGGMYYFRKTGITTKVFEDAFRLAKDYAYYNFRIFNNPADEPVFALAMALNNCRPIPYSMYALSCFWNTELELEMKHGSALRKNATKVPLVHWGTRNTRTPRYNQQVAQLDYIIDNIGSLRCRMIDIKYVVLIFLDHIIQRSNRDVGIILSKLSEINWLKTIWHKIRGKA